MLQPRKCLMFAGVLALAAATVFILPGCKKEQPGGAGSAEAINLETLSNIMGKAGAMTSGIFEMGKTTNGYRLIYHLYVPEGSDFDDYIGADMAPKIQKLYQTFKDLDRVTFVVETTRTVTATDWTPYCSFLMTRKIYAQTGWTNLLGRDLFKVCKEISYSK